MAEILDLELLRTFLEVTESGSFTRAGQRLNRVQSAVSMQIRRLESIIGRSLFRRKGRTVELTDAGAQLVGYARRMLSLSEEAMAAVGEREDIGPVRPPPCFVYAIGDMVRVARHRDRTVVLATVLEATYADGEPSYRLRLEAAPGEPRDHAAAVETHPEEDVRLKTEAAPGGAFFLGQLCQVRGVDAAFTQLVRVCETEVRAGRLAYVCKHVADGWGFPPL